MIYACDASHFLTKSVNVSDTVWEKRRIQIFCARSKSQIFCTERERERLVREMRRVKTAQSSEMLSCYTVYISTEYQLYISCFSLTFQQLGSKNQRIFRCLIQHNVWQRARQHRSAERDTCNNFDLSYERPISAILYHFSLSLWHFDSSRNSWGKWWQLHSHMPNACWMRVVCQIGWYALAFAWNLPQTQREQICEESHIGSDKLRRKRSEKKKVLAVCSLCNLAQ